MSSVWPSVRQTIYCGQCDHVICMLPGSFYCYHHCQRHCHPITTTMMSIKLPIINTSTTISSDVVHNTMVGTHKRSVSKSLNRRHWTTTSQHDTTIQQPTWFAITLGNSCPQTHCITWPLNPTNLNNYIPLNQLNHRWEPISWKSVQWLWRWRKWSVTMNKHWNVAKNREGTQDFSINTRLDFPILNQYPLLVWRRKGNSDEHYIYSRIKRSRWWLVPSPLSVQLWVSRTSYGCISACERRDKAVLYLVIRNEFYLFRSHLFLV